MSLALDAVTKRFGRSRILRGVDLALVPGERHALIGPNGAGKSTLFDCITGRHAPTSGTVTLDGRDVTGWAPQRIVRAGLSRSFQATHLFPAMSVFENVRCALLARATLRGSVDRNRDLNERARALLERIALAHAADIPAGTLAHSDQRALEIGVTLGAGARTLLLDEPTAGMNRAETERIVALLRDVTKDRTLLMVEHDMGVVFDLADRISVLVDGRILVTDTPERVRADPRVREAYLGTA